MSFATRHKKGGINWGVETEGFEYFSLKQLLEMNGPEEKYTLKGVFVNRNKSEKELKEYGPSVVGILEDKLVNFPGHMLSDVEEMLSSEEDIAAIKAGEAVFTIRTYESHGKTCYSPDWVEVVTD